MQEHGQSDPNPLDEAFMRAYYDAYNSENAEALRKFYHDDVALESAQGTLHGADAILATYSGILALFEDQMQPGQIRINGNQAEVEIVDRFTARQAVEDFMGQSLAAGESFELQLRGRYTVNDARFSHIVIEVLGN